MRHDGSRTRDRSKGREILDKEPGSEMGGDGVD
jgi:hypothetical protein